MSVGEMRRFHVTKMRNTLLIPGDADVDNWPVCKLWLLKLLWAQKSSLKLLKNTVCQDLLGPGQSSGVSIFTKLSKCF